MNITIIDTGCANLSSVKFALDRLGYQADITRDLDKIQSADKLLLPGVGTALAAMRNLHDRKLIETIQNAQQPMLGICLGMQLMTDYSTEGDVPTLALMNARTELLPDCGLPLPHMGWNKVNYQAGHHLFRGIEEGAYFYFVHGFAMPVCSATIAHSTYGEAFTAAVQQDNFFGVQFHPERSGQAGSQLLKNFLEM